MQAAIPTRIVSAPPRKNSVLAQRWLPALPLLIFLCAAYLAIVRLDNTYFWDDEAEVGIIGRNLANQGTLTAWDGRNLFAYYYGTTIDKDLRPINPPFQYCVAAASFKVFGASTWSGRFPFVLFGLASLGLFWLILRNSFREQPLIRLYAFGLCAFSMTFLLHIRQCRYFSLTLFFTLLTYYCYARGVTKQRFRDFVVMGAAAALLFYSHFLLSAVVVMSLCVTHLLLQPRQWKLLLKPIVGLLVFLALTTPYAIAYKVWQRPDLANTEPWFKQKAHLLWWTLRELNSMNMIPWLLTAPTLWFLWRNRKKETVRKVFPWLAFVLGNILFLSLLTSMANGMSEAPMRFFLFMLPFQAVIFAAFLAHVHERQKFVALFLFAGLTFTNVFSLAKGNTQFRWLMPALVCEVHQDYPTSYRATANYLQANVRQDDNVMCFPEYCTYPLMFYAGDKVRFSGLLEPRADVEKQRKFSIGQLDALHAPLFADEDFPEYFITFGSQPLASDLMTFFSRPHRHQGQTVRYYYKPITNLNVLWADLSRPELPRHHFGPKKDFSPEEGVTIYKAELVKL